MRRNLIIGILLSSVFIYLSIRGIDFKEVSEGLKMARYGYLLPVICALFVTQALRSYRWGVILGPLGKVDQLSLFSVTCVGFMAITIIPIRIGEIVRPYLINTKSDIKMSSALATIFVERVLDGLTLMAILFMVMLSVQLPPWVSKAGTIFFSLIFLILIAMAFLLKKRAFTFNLLNPLLRMIPERLSSKLEEIIQTFIDGFKVLLDIQRILYAIVLSFAIWFLAGFTIYIMFSIYDLQLPLIAAYVVLVITALGIIIPAAPGFVGNFHFFCIVGLTLFGVSKIDALTFSIVYHFIVIAVIIVLGLIFLPSNKFSIPNLRCCLNLKKDEEQG